MRLIGHLENDKAARVFGDYLYVKGIENSVEEETDKRWSVWVADEDQLALGARLLEEFRANPSAPEYRQIARVAPGLRAQEEAEHEAAKRRTFDRANLFRNRGGYGVGRLTLTLIAACVLVGIYSKLGGDKSAIHYLFISEQVSESLLPEVLAGEFWRLFTPVLIHFSFLHLLFNMMWLLDLGSMIEARFSTGYLAGLLAVIAVTSNLAQYLVGGPAFGGMSGVVYGLFGFIWIRGKLDPNAGLFIEKQNVIMMIAWFALCMTGWLGPIANTAHAAGLAVGAVWGWLSGKFLRA